VALETPEEDRRLSAGKTREPRRLSGGVV